MWISSFPITIFFFKDCLSPLNNIGIRVKIIWHICEGLFPCSLFCSIVGLFLFVFMTVLHCFDSCNFVISFKIRKSESSIFVVFQDFLAIQSLLRVHWNITMKRKEYYSGFLLVQGSTQLFPPLSNFLVLSVWTRFYLYGSWWRGLTECGPLEKGMANHFSILALRTPWTVWEGKKIGYWKVGRCPACYWRSVEK